MPDTTDGKTGDQADDQGAAGNNGGDAAKGTDSGKSGDEPLGAAGLNALQAERDARQRSRTSSSR